ncbi:MAG: fibrobacter succinogenes major paralogous domain-containing protein, partial [Bacteroidales bacterium]|nr:fibrobacter succinogenes major paralogous domain-containing protein [Bacteroidales bacterium]
SGRQGICPAGYHIPTDLEWSRYEWCVETTINPTGSTSLTTFQTVTGLRGSNNPSGPGDKMKITDISFPSWMGSNASGFNALPAGARSNGGFANLGSHAYYWTATEFNNTDSWYRGLLGGLFESARVNNGTKIYGYSVRCLQN